nr:hypothetical protein [uncultured Shewanella sp.]
MKWLKKLFSIKKPDKTKSDDRDKTQSNAYELIGGEKAIRQLAKEFYKQMRQRKDTVPLLAIHRSPIEDSEQKLFEFLSGCLYQFYYISDLSAGIQHAVGKADD